MLDKINYKINRIWIRINILIGKILKISIKENQRKKFNYMEFLKYIENKSFVRFGDDEAIILMGGSIWFQKANAELKKKLLLVLKDKNLLKCYHPAIFDKLLSKDWENLFYFYKKYEKSDFICSAIWFRRNNNELDDSLIERLELFFGLLSNKEIILVHNNPKIKKICEIILNKKIKYIQIPAKNAFKNINEIKEQIISEINLNLIKKSMYRILISAGPTANVLVLDKLGIIAWDVGDIEYEQYFCYLKDKNEV